MASRPGPKIFRGSNSSGLVAKTSRMAPIKLNLRSVSILILEIPRVVRHKFIVILEHAFSPELNHWGSRNLQVAFPNAPFRPKYRRLKRSTKLTPKSCGYKKYSYVWKRLFEPLRQCKAFQRIWWLPLIPQGWPETSLLLWQRRMAWRISMLLMLKAPTAYPPFGPGKQFPIRR